MLVLSPQTKVFLAADSTDMRKSFRGLIALTEAVLNQDPASGHLFVFVNGRRTLLKILHWDGSGWWIWYRQLEQGTRLATYRLHGEPSSLARRLWQDAPHVDETDRSSANGGSV
jgi:transposase